MKLRNVCVVAVALTMAPLAGCGWFDDPTPDEARVSLEGAAGEDVQIVMSKQFLTGVTTDNVTQVELFQSDTLIRSMPFDTTINISNEQRFFVRTIDVDTVSTTARMQVFIDGTARYDQQTLVTVEQLLFLFAFNQPVTSFIELL